MLGTTLLSIRRLGRIVQVECLRRTVLSESGNLLQTRVEPAAPVGTVYVVVPAAGLLGSFVMPLSAPVGTVCILFWRLDPLGLL